MFIIKWIVYYSLFNCLFKKTQFKFSEKLFAVGNSSVGTETKICDIE